MCPSRPRPVYVTSPIWLPCTVTDPDPVPALFSRRITLIIDTSTVHPSVTLPDLSPAVITTRRVPRAPCVTMHRTDVSDSHSVASHPVCPSRPLAVNEISPIFVPCTVTDPDPVPARFCRRITLSTAISTDHACVTLPDLSPAVITTRRVPRTPNTAA